MKLIARYVEDLLSDFADSQDVANFSAKLRFLKPRHLSRLSEDQLEQLLDLFPFDSKMGKLVRLWLSSSRAQAW